jgi:hypothetical protein
MPMNAHYALPSISYIMHTAHWPEHLRAPSRRHYVFVPAPSVRLICIHGKWEILILPVRSLVLIMFPVLILHLQLEEPAPPTPRLAPVRPRRRPSPLRLSPPVRGQSPVTSGTSQPSAISTVEQPCVTEPKAREDVQPSSQGVNGPVASAAAEDSEYRRDSNNSSSE